VTYLVEVDNRVNLFHASTVLYMYIIKDIVDKVGRIHVCVFAKSNNVQKIFCVSSNGHLLASPSSAVKVVYSLTLRIMSESGRIALEAVPWIFLFSCFASAKESGFSC
jgi:hypothetical protein